MNIAVALALYSAIPLSSASDPTPLPEVAVVGPTVRLGDFNGDGLPDAYIVHPASGDRLLRNQGDGTFADVTEQSGLSGIRASRMALWQDYDRDGALDLFVCSAAGKSRLMRNLGNGSFADATRDAGIAHLAQNDLWAEWIDYDGDRLPDLHVVTDRGDRIYHNCGGGSFEPADLRMQETVVTQVLVPADVALLETPQGSGRNPSERSLDTRDLEGREQGRDLGVAVGPTYVTPAGPHARASWTNCFNSLIDQALPSACLEASSSPMLGTLHPLSINLNVSGAGNVGVGTTTPAAKLDVTGNVRSSGQLVSTAVSGAPLAVTSGTLVTNLNADKVDGLDASAFSQMGNSIESSEVTDGALVNADVSGSAAIAGTKVLPNFGSQTIQTSGPLTVGGDVGIGTAVPEGPLHVSDGSAGSVTADPNSIAVFERSTDNYIHMLGPAASQKGILFGDPALSGRLGVVVNNDSLEFRTGGNNARMTIGADGRITMEKVPDLNVPLLYVRNGSAGSFSHSWAGTGAFFEGAFENRIVLRAPNGSDQSIIFDYPNPVNTGRIDYDGSPLRMRFSAGGGFMGLGATGLGIGPTLATNPSLNPLHVVATGTASGGVAGIPQVVAHFKQSTITQAGAVSIDASSGQDSILYLAENGAAVWDLRNDAGSSDNLTINHLGTTTMMTIDTSGEVGIGTTSPATKLHLAEDGGPTVRWQDLGAGGPTFHIGIGSDDTFRISETGVGDRIFIDKATGIVGIKRNPTTNSLEVEGEASKTTAGIWAANSDRRIKTEIRDV